MAKNGLSYEQYAFSFFKGAPQYISQQQPETLLYLLTKNIFYVACPCIFIEIDMLNHLIIINILEITWQNIWVSRCVPFKGFLLYGIIRELEIFKQLLH